MSKRKRRGRDQAPLSPPPSPPQPQTQLEQQAVPPASRTVATRSITSTTRFEGPIPPPAALADYDKVFPGCAERLVALAESQSAHRQELEKTVVRANVAAERSYGTARHGDGPTAVTGGRRAHTGPAGAAMTGGGPVVNASPTGVLSRSGPGGAPGGPQRRTAQPLTRQARGGIRACSGECG